MRHIPAVAFLLTFSLGILVVPTGAHSASVNLDFSSGTFFDRPPGSGVDFYMEDGFTVEIANVSHNTSMASCPTRWCFDNGYTTPAETTLITRDNGGMFDLDSIQVTQNGNSGLNFSADGGAFLKFTGVGTATFGPEFDDITIVQITIPCVGQYNSCYGTIDNVNASVIPIPAALPLFSSVLGLMGFVGWKRKKAS